MSKRELSTRWWCPACGIERTGDACTNSCACFRQKHVTTIEPKTIISLAPTIMTPFTESKP